MALFFFDINDGVAHADEEGTDLASLEAAKREAAILAAGLLRDNPAKFWEGSEWTVRVRDDRNILFEITFLASLLASVDPQRIDG